VTGCFVGVGVRDGSAEDCDRRLPVTCCSPTPV